MQSYRQITATVALVLGTLLAAPVWSQDTRSEPNNYLPSPTPALAAPPENVVSIRGVIVAEKVDQRAIRLEAFLKRQRSPLSPYAEDFVTVADKYDLDWRLLPAISGLESGYGVALLSGSHNPFGWGGGRIYFSSYPASFEVVASGLRSRYVRSGAITPYNIGPKYAANPHWADRVSAFMKQID